MRASVLKFLQSGSDFSRQSAGLWVPSFKFLQSHLNFCRQGCGRVGFGS